MSSSRRISTSNNIVFDIPSELVQSGKTLIIEEYFELFVDGRHLSKPAHSVRQAHGLCLIDPQQQDLRSVNSVHQLESTMDEDQLVQVIIEFSPECLNSGKTITLEKIDSSGENRPSGNFEDLYTVHQSTKSNESNNIHIKIPKQSFQRGQTIVIQQGNILAIKSNDYQKEQSHHLNNNQFAKRDHLQSKNLMQLTVEVPPEILADGRTVTFRREDPQLLVGNFPFRRQSKPDISV